MKSSIKIFLAIFVFFFSFSALAQEAGSEAVVNYRQQLEKELQNLETQIDSLRSVIEGKQREATTFERDIAILDAQINKAKLEIKARNISINNLAQGITDRVNLINNLLGKLDEEKKSLSELIRRVDELDSMSLAEVVLGYAKFSDFFADSDNFESINKAIQTSFDEIKQTKGAAEQEKADLEDKKAEEVQLRYLQELEKKRQEENEANKKSLLKLTKSQEEQYQGLMTSRQKDAAKIRGQLFILQGSPAIPFEKALDYANIVSKITGIRPAFLLGVIAEESNLGANVGKGSWKVDLANYRCSGQRQDFSEITAGLGLDPDLMPVSKKVWYGYCGGAMGPAQFMPSTWKLYASRITQITGHNPPNPWDPLDAFAGASLLLTDNGAINGNYASERKAALKYLAGARWNKAAYSFYGDDVMALAQKYQEQINILQGN